VKASMYRRAIVRWLCGVASSLLFATAMAQVDPRQALAGTIVQLQTGTPNPAWYGPQLWQTIAMQTNNTGVYPQLVNLGAVTNIVITQHQVLPGGNLYSMTATHQWGTSTWLFGIGNNPLRTEYASFNVSSLSQLPQPQPLPTAPPSGPPGPQSDSCKKFPNLCP